MDVQVILVASVQMTLVMIVQQVHLTYNSPTAVTISWVTGEYQLGPDVTPTNTEGVKSMVYYEALSPNVSMEATGFTTTYQQIYK